MTAKREREGKRQRPARRLQQQAELPPNRAADKTKSDSSSSSGVVVCLNEP